jgi:serine/threonine-protein kinase
VAGDKATITVDGRYSVEGELGRGGMGVVYLAKDAWLSRPVALKLIAPRWSSDPQITAGFHQEAVALAAIRSQHVVQVYAFGRHEGSYFFAMEYVAGRSLGQLLIEYARHGDAIPLHRALTILNRIAEGLGCVHAASLVHRDVKPDNIVIEEGTGRPVLVDFGLAAPSDASGELALVGGSPLFMAPEQVQGSVKGAGVSPQSDVYSLACTAFVMLSGSLPFRGEFAAEVLEKHLYTPAPAISSVRPDLAPFDPVFARALAKDPAERYSSCMELVRALEAANGALSEGEPATRSARPAPSDRGAALRVLVVDDDPIFRKFATRAVQLAFYGETVRIECAATGAEALTRAERDAPDLVLLDFDMPGLDGVDTLSRLRSLPRGDKVRVVVLSGRVGEEDNWRFSILGVTDFVSKPVDLESLIDTIGAVAERAGWRSPSTQVIT